ncbi:MAG: tetratricopeptide repeat protein, partial [Cyanobacteria bacterium P01_C01_bin.70]
MLAGYPLALEVVLANLGRQRPAEILAVLDAADVNLDSGSEDKTQSILKCVEYSHSNLSPEAQKLLLCLAPFKGFIDRADLANYSKQLQQLESFQGYPFEKFDEAVEEALSWGLVSPMSDEMPRLLTIQPVFPYFLKTKLAELNEETRHALDTGFKNHYQALAELYEQLMGSKSSQERQYGLAFVQLEYENLFSALQTCLRLKDSFYIFVCLDEYFKLTSDPSSRLKLMERVCKELEKYPDRFLDRVDGYQLPFAFHRLASACLAKKQYSDARSAYEKALDAYAKLDQVDKNQKQSWISMTYHQMGRVAEEQRQYEQAQQYYQQALDIKIEFGDRYEQAGTYHQMGSVAQKQRQYEQAQQYYQQALDIKIEFGDRYEQARTYHQMGIVAQEQRHFEQAQQYYQQALDI